VNKTQLVILVFAAAALFAFLGLPVSAGDKVQRQQKPEPAKEEPKPAPALELDTTEVNEARAFAAGLPARERAMLDGLRYLMRPEFQEELLQGRKHRTCPLEPIETPAKGQINLTYALRLWAVLESGMPCSPGLITEVNRLRATTVAAPTRSLSEVAVHIAILRNAASRPDWPMRDQLCKRATELFKLCEGAADMCSPRSSFVTPNKIQVGWFANHFWRALATRCAYSMGIATESKQWGKDLEALSKSFVEKQGWVSVKGMAYDVSGDLNANLLAMAALSMAADAPEGLISKGDAKGAATQLQRGKDVLQRLQTTYADGPFGGARLLPLIMLNGKIAPDIAKDQAKWLEAIINAVCATQTSSGNFKTNSLLASDMELGEMRYAQDAEGQARETSLVVIALCGGTLNAKPPLAGKSIFDVGMSLHSLALVEAASARVMSGDTSDLVNQAIDAGVEYLRSIQTKVGNFEGSYQTYNSQVALCLLAMLHGGVPRTDVAVEKAMKWLDEKKWAVLTYSYDAGILLMLLQKYYEKEAMDAGLFTAKNPADFKTARTKLRDSIPPERNKIIDQIISNLEDARITSANGGYTYGRVADHGGYSGDNSCTQYALLAFHAASLLGADIRGDVFKREARRLLDSYFEAKEIAPIQVETEDSKGKKTSTKIMVQPGGWGYSTGKTGAILQFAAAGMGSLAICIDELRLRGELASDLEDQCEHAILGAAAYISENYKSDPNSPYGGIGSLEIATDGHGAYYNLYSVERGASLANLRLLNGKTDWYDIGSRLLIDAQNEDGSWAQSRSFVGGATHTAVVNTCMAILFLKRASMPVLTDHKKREQPPAKEEPKKEGPITGK
jgi:hypothetical protein